MPFEKGQSGNPNGKVKGTVNKDTALFKQALNNLLETAAPNMVQWLEVIAQDSPEKAFAVLKDFAEYIHPKLSRTEHQPLDKNGDPADNKMTIEFVNAPSDTSGV